MSQKDLTLAKAYAEKVTGLDMDSMTHVPISPMEALEIFWGLNDIFRKALPKIKDLAYSSEYETKADEAIEAFAKRPVEKTWGKYPPPVWRVLLERHQQLLVTILANEAANQENFGIIPLQLPNEAKLPFLMLFWLHQMKLPQPPTDRHNLELPVNAQAPSLRRH